MVCTLGLKTYAFSHVRAKTMLWVDCNNIVIKNLGPIFEEIEDKGYYISVCNNSLKDYIHPESLKNINIPIDESTPMVNTCFFGFNNGSKFSKTVKAAHVLSMAPSVFDYPVKRHRYDQAILSVLLTKVSDLKFKKIGDIAPWKPHNINDKSFVLKNRARPMNMKKLFYILAK